MSVQPYRHYTPEETAEIARLFNEGLSHKYIANAVGRTELAIMSHLHKRGLIRKHGRGDGLTEMEKRRIDRMLEGDLYVNEIARRMHRSPGTISRYIRSKGLNFRYKYPLKRMVEADDKRRRNYYVREIHRK